MTVYGERFCKEIGQIINTGNIDNTKLVETDTVLYPMQAHVYRFRHFGSDRFIG